MKENDHLSCSYDSNFARAHMSSGIVGSKAGIGMMVMARGVLRMPTARKKVCLEREFTRVQETFEVCL